jgi:hypothetical protein
VSVRTKLLALLIAVWVLAAGVGLYFTPHLALRGIRKAADTRDAAALSEYVDYPAVRDSLKVALHGKIAPVAANDNPLLAMGLALANAVADPMIDTLVTPESLSRLFEGQSPATLAPPATAGVHYDPLAGIETTTGYEDLNTFAVTIKNTSLPTTPVGLVLTRDGLLRWKLSAIRLP